MNASKSEYIIIGHRKRLLRLNTDPYVFSNDQIIDRVANTKILGVLIDENITWKTHINHVCKKSVYCKSIGVLRRAKRMISKASLERLFNASFLSHFVYTSLVWENRSDELKTQLQRLQNKAARVITGDSYYSSATETLSKLGWETLQCRRDKQIFSLVNKNIGGDSKLSNLFRLSNRDCYDLRSNNNTLMLPKPNTNAMKRNFGYRGAILWNLNHENNYR